MTKRLAVIMTCLLAAFGLVSCGGDDDPDAARTAPTGGTTPAATAKGTAIKDPAEGGYVAKMKALSVPAELALSLIHS